MIGGEEDVLMEIEDRVSTFWVITQYLILQDNFTVEWNPDVFNLWKLFPTWILLTNPILISPKLPCRCVLLGGYVFPVESD